MKRLLGCFFCARSIKPSTRAISLMAGSVMLPWALSSNPCCSFSPVLPLESLGVRVAWSLLRPANWSTWRPLFKAVFHLEANKIAEADYMLPGNRTLGRDRWARREITEFTKNQTQPSDSALNPPSASFTSVSYIFKKHVTGSKQI